MMPLSGVTVLELGMVLQVPLAAQMLGDYGANVIKVERPPRGDIIRDLDDIGTERGEMSCYYAAVGRNKRTICLDLKQADGKKVLHRLIEQADVLIHNFRPGVMHRLGLDYETVSKLNPRLIYAESYPFGEIGPLSHMPGQDLLAQSLSGFAFNGVADGDAPKLTSTPVIDYTAAVTLTQGILAALLERGNSGKGDRVSTSLYDVAIAMQPLETASRTFYGYKTNWLQYAMVFPTQDGWITVLTLFRKNPLRLMCEAFDVEDMSKEPELATEPLQRRNSEKLYKQFSPIIEQYSTEECIERLSSTDVLCAPVLELDEALNHPQTKANGVVWEIPVPDRGTVRVAGNPVQLTRSQLSVNRGPTALGECSEEILREFGYDQKDISQMRSAGIVN